MDRITAQYDPRELAHRVSDGIGVWLYWHPDEERVFVRCVDERLDDVFELDVAAERALDAFEHPYAYAALAGGQTH